MVASEIFRGLVVVILYGVGCPSPRRGAPAESAHHYVRSSSRVTTSPRASASQPLFLNTHIRRTDNPVPPK